ncbi:MAG: hypothetical protein RLO52_23045 [Sandaracinaceae bacterium]|mgnify:CR=1|nr:MAG: hypothetical protein EVA89_21220 [Sandaracinaceae bacterium]
MRATALAAAALPLLLPGCANLILVELGEGSVQPFRFERTFSLSERARDTCPFGTVESSAEDARRSVVTFAPVDGACLVDIALEDARLLTQERVAARAERLAAKGDIGAVRALDLVLTTLVLEDQDGAPLPLEHVRSLVISVDGEAVWRERDVAQMASSGEARATMPQGFVDRFVRALLDREELRADLGLRLVIDDPRQLVPAELRVDTVLQPVVLVDGLDAKL